MFLPIGDAPNPRGFFPWLTWLIIAINVLVHVSLALPASSEQWAQLVTRYGFVPGDPEPFDLFASLFLHANLAHLLGNMLFLWIYGDNVEYWLGRLWYGLMYVGSGIAATLSFAAFAGDPSVPLIGASGAISGVLGAYFVAFPRNRIKVLVGFPPLIDVWYVPAPLVLGLYVIVDNLLPFLLTTGSSVAYGAHLGGFVSGLLFALVARLFGGALQQREDPWLAHVEQGEALLQQGARAAAFQHLVLALQRSGDPAVRARARAALRALDLDPRLAARLGL